ncbi:hypothetical protein [Paraburkholderia ultramafica]|uniref:hypothetical protein n=1 Tax=Paraburkholderia ultramafica TaxID=1544867 RepID=UPI001583ADB1|nr:hypothetical protein [Paraburkholderia ultramafica]
MARRCAPDRIGQLAFALTAFGQPRRKEFEADLRGIAREGRFLESSHAVSIDIDHVEARI